MRQHLYYNSHGYCSVCQAKAGGLVHYNQIELQTLNPFDVSFLAWMFRLLTNCGVDDDENERIGSLVIFFTRPSGNRIKLGPKFHRFAIFLIFKICTVNVINS